jgi:tetratricopeptide (TPR) repeat protein
MAKAEWAANEALRLDPNLAEAHTSLGNINLRRYWNWAEAEREFKLAISIDPSYAPAHYSYSNVLSITGRLKESITQSELARSLDPFSPITTLNYCRTFYYGRDFDRASTCFEKLVKEEPGYDNARYVLGLVYLRKGRYEDATGIFEELYHKDKAPAGAALGYTYAITNRRDDALRILSEMEALKSDGYIAPQEFAVIYLGLGDKETALGWLRKAADEKFAPLALIGVEPMFDSIRSDPAFIELLKSLALPLRPTG